MTEAADQTRSVIVERDLPAPPHRVWRALTEPHLIESWLMRTDFKLQVGHRFTLTQEWGSVDCRVLDIEPERALSYSWEAMGLVSVVTWTLTPTAEGTHLRMEQSGFRADQEQAYQGAKFGWARFLASLDRVVASETAG